MSFEALIDKVKQAESALEAKERETAADWRQLKSSWLASWTPGRIVVAGLISGFIVGKVEPVKKMTTGEFSDLGGFRATFSQAPRQLVLRVLRGNARGDLPMQ